MIDYLEDTNTGKIDSFPHIMSGDLKVASYGNVNVFSTGFSMSGAEIIKYDDEYIYIRMHNNPSTVYLCEPNGYCSKSVPASELGLRY